MGISVNLTGNILLIDSSGNSSPLVKSIASLTMSGTSFSEAQGLATSTTPLSITLPISPITFLYLKNLDATNTVIVSWTPNGGSSNVVQTLEPGSGIIVIQAGSGAGITALSVTAGAGTPAIEYILAG